MLLKKTVLLLFSVFCISFAAFAQKTTDYKTSYFVLSVNERGFVTHFTDRQKGTDYLPPDQQVPLLTIYRDSVFMKPVSCKPAADGQGIKLKYSNGSVATIQIKSKGDYLRMELKALEPRNGTEAIIWGPYATTINQKIGETICVVRDQQYAIGMQALHINTIEGLPDADDDAGGGGVIEPLPGQHLPDSLSHKIGQHVDVNVNVTGDMPEYVRLYRGSAAVKKPYGSELRLFSRDRRWPRIINNRQGKYKQYVQPIDVDFSGSAVALFGCPVNKTLDVIEKVEVGERLPHPVLNGVWIKRSPIPGEAYLLNEGDPVKATRYAKACGFQLIHTGDIFQNWGHFDINKRRFPNGPQDVRKVADAAHKEGISLGVHTLTMFTTKNDPYVTPVPSDNLCKTGSSVLTKDAGATDEVIYIREADYFRLLGNTHTVKIGKELINYRKVSDEAPWRLLDCKRGQYGTIVSFHKAGDTIDKLTNDDYSGFFPDIHLQDAYAKRLAQVCKETGIDLMDFDGFGGGSPTGHGTYGAARFIDLWYHNLDRYRLTSGAGTFHYYWHIYSFMNWGEPWYNALRESQVNYRIENQRYFDRNLMPGMLGWFSLIPTYRPEEVEWIQARSAGFNAGYLMRIDESIEKNGFKEDLFALIKEWQKARMANVFTEDQRERMKDPKNEFHLQKTKENSWQLYPVKLSPHFEFRFREVQTGEPVAKKFQVENLYDDQPLQFYIRAIPVENDMNATVSQLQLKINDYEIVAIDIPLKAGDGLYCDGQHVYLCDNTWNRKRTLSTGKIPVMGKGNNDVQVSGEFSNPTAPKLDIEFKTLGKPEQVGKK